MIEKKSALFRKEWWSGVHSIFENGSERVSALIFLLMSESWAKLKKLMSVEHVENIVFSLMYFFSCIQSEFLAMITS